MKFYIKMMIAMSLMTHVLSASVYLPEKYLVTYGNPQAPIKITEYYSFYCPHCIALFKREFSTIKEKYLNKGDIYLVFHPVPMDMLTVQAMDCLEKFSPERRRLFLEAVLDEIDTSDSDLCIRLLEKAMKVMNSVTVTLSDRTYMEKTAAFNDAFVFIKNDSKPEDVPSVAVNGCFVPGEIPSEEFIQRCLKKKGEKICSGA